MFKQQKKKINLKKRIKKFSNGAISLMLCILMTPLLSLTLSMVEYARYQEVISITKELMELTGVSEVSDYDTYLHDRFGLLATSQEGTLGDGAEELFLYNMGTLGNQTTVTDGSFRVTGGHSLYDTDVLRRQIVSVSELAGPTAVLLHDLELEGLLQKLNEIQALTSMATTIGQVADVVEEMNSCVTALENLQSSATELQTNISTTVAAAQDFYTRLESLWTKLNTEEGLIPADFTDESIYAVADTFASSYLTDFIDLIKSGQTLRDSITSTTESLDSFKTSITDFETAVDALSDKIDAVGSSGSENADDATDVAMQSIEDVLTEMEDLIDDTLADMKTSTIDAAKSTLGDISSAVLDSTGLTSVYNRYYQIVNGQYFEDIELEDDEKADLKAFMMAAWDSYDSANPSALSNQLSSMFIPSISSDFSLDDLLTDIGGLISDATSSIATDNLGKVTELLNKLVNLLESLFSMRLLVDPNLNGFVNIETYSVSPYQQFLSAVGNIFDAIETVADFFSGDGDVSFAEALEAIVNGLRSAGEALGLMLEIALGTFNGLIEFVTNLTDGDIGALYEKFVIAAYVRHNFTNRTTDIESESGLTGFSYADIVRPERTVDNTLSNGITGIVSFINNVCNSDAVGSDENFVLAEQEYVLVGSNSEYFNQLISFMQVYSLRFVLNMLPVFRDPCVSTIAAAATIGAFLVYLIYLIVEPLLDTILLVNGGDVGLIKDGCWMTPDGIIVYLDRLGGLVTENSEVSEIINSGGQDLADEMEEKFSGTAGGGAPGEFMTTGYDTHLLLLMFISLDSEDEMVPRIRDIINLETTTYYKSQGLEFDMNKAYTAVTMEAEVRFNPFFDVGKYFSGTPLDMTGTVKQMVCY